MPMSASPLRPWERIAKLWFALDAIVALAPPLYWAANGATTPVLGLPAALFYFLSVSGFIAASIVFAYLVGSKDDGA